MQIVQSINRYSNSEDKELTVLAVPAYISGVSQRHIQIKNQIRK